MYAKLFLKNYSTSDEYHNDIENISSRLELQTRQILTIAKNFANSNKTEYKIADKSWKNIDNPDRFQKWNNYSQLFSDSRLIQDDSYTNNIIIKDKDSIEILRNNGVFSNILKLFFDQINDTRKLNGALEHEINDLKTRMKVSSISYEMQITTFNGVYSLCLNIQNQYELLLSNVSRVPEIYSLVPGLNPNPRYDIITEVMTNVSSMKSKMQEISLTKKILNAREDNERVNGMRNLMINIYDEIKTRNRNRKHGFSEEELLLKGAKFNWNYSAANEIKNRVAFLMKTLIERTNFIMDRRADYISTLENRLNQKQMKIKNEIMQIKKIQLAGEQIEAEKLHNLVNNKRGLTSTGYGYDDERLIALLNKKAYPNSMKNLIDLVKINEERRINSSLEGELNNETYEENFDKNMQNIDDILKMLVQGINSNENENSMTPYQMQMSRDLNTYITILRIEDDQEQRLNFSISNDHFKTKVDLISSIMLSIKNDSSLSEATPFIIDALVFEVNSEILRIINHGTVTTDEYTLLDNAINICKIHAGSNTVDKLMTKLNSAMKTIPLVESKISSKRVPISTYLIDRNDEKVLKTIEEENKIDHLHTIHKVGEVFRNKHQLIAAEYNKIEPNHPTFRGIFIEFMEITLKTELIILEVLFRFIMDNSLNPSNLINKSNLSINDEAFYKIMAYDENEGKVFKEIVDELELKIGVADQMNFYTANLSERFSQVKIKIISLLQEKEESKNKIRLLMLNEIANISVLDKAMTVAITTVNVNFINSKLTDLFERIQALKLNHLGAPAIIEFILSISLYIRLQAWKSFINEILSRLNTHDL